MAGHNTLHRLTSTVSYESQTLRQEVTTLSPLINKHYERQLLSINQSYINYFFAVKAYYNDLLWYGRTPNRYGWATNVARMATESEIYFVADFHSMALLFDAIVLRGLQSRLLFTCGSAKSSNFQINLLSRYKSFRVSAQLQRGYRGSSRYYLWYIKLLNHIFCSAFSQKGYRQRGTVSEKRMHFA